MKAIGKKKKKPKPKTPNRYNNLFQSRQFKVYCSGVVWNSRHFFYDPYRVFLYMTHPHSCIYKQCYKH